MSKEISITFSALADPLREQLPASVSDERCAQFQRTADAITRLHVLGYISDGSTMAARKRLAKSIAKEISERRRA